MQTIHLKIDGMHCGGCVSAVRRVLEAVPAVTAVSLDLATGSASVDGSAELDRARLMSAVEDAGYGCEIAH
jgi:copper chaperone CopZ